MARSQGISNFTCTPRVRRFTGIVDHESGTLAISRFIYHNDDAATWL